MSGMGDWSPRRGAPTAPIGPSATRVHSESLTPCAGALILTPSPQTCEKPGVLSIGLRCL